MTEKQTPPEVGGNITALKREIKKAVDRIESLKADRTSTNADIQTIMEELKAKGISREAVNAALRYQSWDEAQRRSFDIAYEIVREALGLPKQGDIEAVIRKGKAEHGEATAQ